MKTLKVGNTITVMEDRVLGTPEASAEIVEVTDFGYMVIIDGDDPEWAGPIDFNGNILQAF